MRLSYFQFLPLSDFLHLKSANIKIVSSIFSFINSELLNQAEYTIFSNGRIPSGGVKFTVSQRLPLLFESCTVHHTVRTRTRFFMKKGSGTFFVYGRFCGGTTRNSGQERVKAGYHYDSGILPFALRDQVRFVRTWSSTLYGALRANRCVRPYMAGTHVRRKKGKF